MALVQATVWTLAGALVAATASLLAHIRGHGEIAAALVGVATSMLAVGMCGCVAMVAVAVSTLQTGQRD